MWHISTVPFVTASAACRPGTISLEAKTWIWNLLSVMSATWSAMTWAAVKMVSSERGKLEVQRHLSSGVALRQRGLGERPGARRQARGSGGGAAQQLATHDHCLASLAGPPGPLPDCNPRPPPA